MALRHRADQGQAATYAVKFVLVVHALKQLTQLLGAAVVKTCTIVLHHQTPPAIGQRIGLHLHLWRHLAGRELDGVIQHRLHHHAQPLGMRQHGHLSLCGQSPLHLRVLGLQGLHQRRSQCHPIDQLGLQLGARCT